MTQFWIDILFVILVTIATVVADWLANQLILLRRRLSNIRRVVDQAINEADKLNSIRIEVNKFYAAQESYLLWGSDLAAIAFSLDLSILGIWISNQSFFPFFSRWNEININREIPIWLILLFSHFCILLISITLKHTHGADLDSRPSPSTARMWQIQWYIDNRYLILCNMVGFLSLFSSFIIISNAI